MDKYTILNHYFGHTEYRPGQEAMIDAALNHRDALGIMPTGSGKSICYQVPALMFPGITLVISPLISLMKDQVSALKQMGIAAAYINSSLTPAQTAEALRRAALNWYKIIYVAPERLDVPNFLSFALTTDINMVTIDEAHCVSQWGQDFRPSYLKITDFIERLPMRPVVSAFTATATQIVREDIIRMLKLQNPLIRTTGFDRPNLYFEVRKPKDKYLALTDILYGREKLSGIVYCSTRKAVEEVCEKLTLDGFSATRYHAGLPDAERHVNQDDFQYDRKLIMVATNAFGMGIDKSNVSFIVHYNMPKSIESYYQEAGRAGRDGEPAQCVLLYSGQDVITAKWLIDHSEDNPDLSDAERAMVHQRDMDRLKQMTFYSTSKRCLRRFILDYFGERAQDSCGNCSVCLGLAFERASITPVKSQKPKPQSNPVAVDDALFEELKNLRNHLAAERRVPAYVIFSNATLRDMVAKRPTTRMAFLSVAGVGEIKQQQYGEVFLEVIRAYLHNERKG